MRAKLGPNENVKNCLVKAKLQDMKSELFNQNLNKLILSLDYYIKTQNYKTINRN